VPGAGLEPARPRGPGGLSPLRLPIPPSGQRSLRHQLCHKTWVLIGQPRAHEDPNWGKSTSKQEGEVRVQALDSCPRPTDASTETTRGLGECALIAPMREGKRARRDGRLRPAHPASRLEPRDRACKTPIHQPEPVGLRRPEGIVGREFDHDRSPIDCARRHPPWDPRRARERLLDPPGVGLARPPWAIPATAAHDGARGWLPRCRARPAVPPAWQPASRAAPSR
jgi:hypothetical protein